MASSEPSEPEQHAAEVSARFALREAKPQRPAKLVQWHLRNTRSRASALTAVNKEDKRVKIKEVRNKTRAVTTRKCVSEEHATLKPTTNRKLPAKAVRQLARPELIWRANECARENGEEQVVGEGKEVGRGRERKAWRRGV